MDQNKIGKFIAECRKEKSLTQAALAEQLGITDRAVSKWERGKNMPDLSIMPDLCELLGISIDYDSATRTVLLDSQDEGDWVADGYNGYVVDPNGEKTEVPHLSD